MAIEIRVKTADMWNTGLDIFLHKEQYYADYHKNRYYGDKTHKSLG